MPLHINYDPPRGYRLVRQGEVLQKGDIVGGTGFKEEVGANGSTYKGGEPVTAQIALKHPIRKICGSS